MFFEGRGEVAFMHSGGQGSSEVVALVESWLRQAIDVGASDIHFEPGDERMTVRIRKDGLLHELDRVSSTLAPNIVARLKVLAGLLTYRMDIPQEGAFTAGAIHHDESDASPDVRVATFPTVRGERVVIRLLYDRAQATGLDGLGFTSRVNDVLRDAVAQPNGLLLVTGPAGSGKSTTLYALARCIREQTPGRSVVSLEDPVEQRVDGMAQIQISPHGELNYVRAMRSLLRQDVEVLLVGEIRDAETAHVVVEASLTGHLILSTMHSGDPAEAMVRLLEMGIAPYQVVGALRMVCTQRLMRTVCRACGGQGGCASCSHTGYSGRTGCAQVAVLDEALREAILSRQPASVLRTLVQKSGPDLQADARRLVEAGLTTPDEARRVLGRLDEAQ